MTRPFGKPHPSNLPLRTFEVYFRIPAREGSEAWRSGYASVQHLLDHLSRYTKSYSSRSRYLNLLKNFCRKVDHNPDELVGLPKGRIESLVQGFADELAAKDRSKSYVNTVIKRLRTFFRFNGFKGERDLNIATYFVPTRYRKKPEYIPSKDEMYAMVAAAGTPRNRALILCLWSSGLRVSTLSALNYGDIQDELEEGLHCVMVPVYPEMKLRVKNACKGSIPYYTFIYEEAVEALKAYLRKRREKYGSIYQDYPLFHSDWNLWTRSERSRKRLNRRTIGKIVKKAAKVAGLPQWQHVTPHCIRKALKSVLRSPTFDGGRLDQGTQEFLFGHILPGSQDAYYDKTKVEFHREEYMKLDFSRSGSGARWIDAVMAAVKIASAGLGEEPEEVVKKYVDARFGDDTNWRLWPEPEQLDLIRKALEWRRSQQPREGSHPTDKVIKAENLERYLNKGWIFVAQLNPQKVIIRRIRRTVTTR